MILFLDSFCEIHQLTHIIKYEYMWKILDFISLNLKEPAFFFQRNMQASLVGPEIYVLCLPLLVSSAIGSF